VFRCDGCKKVTEPHEPQTRVVAKVRHVKYPRREYKVNGKKVIDPGGTGLEIAKEDKLCIKCATAIDPELTKGLTYAQPTE